MIEPPEPKHRPERKLIRSIPAVCKRCKKPVKMEDGYIAGKAYGFSCCGLVQSVKAPAR